MRYIEDFDDKYGFSDGGAVPPDAWASRDIHVRVLNALLAKHGSNCRYLKYDRPGMHNGCMWLRISLADYMRLSAPDDLVSDFPNIDEIPGDEGHDQAWDAAAELELDNLIHVEVTVNDAALNEIITGIEQETA